MARISSLVLAATGLVALAACSDNNPTAARADAAAATQRGGEHLGIMPLRSPNGPLFSNNGNETNHGEAKPGSGPSTQATGTGISYHGGPLLTSQTKVAAVYWSSSVIYTGGPTPGTTGAGSADGSLVGYFMSHVGGSPYFNINSTYYNAAGTHVANVVNYTQFYANNTSVPASGASVSDAAMLSMLQTAFNTGKLTYDAGTLYNIFTKGTVNLGGGFGSQYCAYHSWGTVTVGGVARTVLYSAMPDDYAKPTACSSGLAAANGDAHADAEVSVLIHEIEETTTDMNGNAWYDSVGNENADKCAWNYGTTFTTALGGKANVTLGSKSFLIQQNWVNSGTGGCRLSW
jgi:hypothetical protein